MKWDFDWQGFPPDLDAHITKARTKAELAFREAEAGEQHQLERKRLGTRSADRQLLIDIRLKPEVLEWARCACELAERGRLKVSEVEDRVITHLRWRANALAPGPHDHYTGTDSAFVKEAEARITGSKEWDAYLTRRLAVAEQLATAGPILSAAPKPEDIAARRKAVIEPRLTAKGWSPRKWAEVSGVAPSVVYDYLKGISTPNVESRSSLAQSLGMSIEDFPA